MEFDGRFVRRDPEVRDLMDEFVRVRITGMGGLDLTTFQFDWDLTFVVFLMNADGTIYARFGTRSAQKEAERDISFEGLRLAMERTLTMHEEYPENRKLFEGKNPPAPRFPVIDEYPLIKQRRNPGHCISCHMVQNAERIYLRSKSKPIPDEVMVPWPMPRLIGLELDPKKTATVKSVARGSPAAKAGFRPADEIFTLGGQAMLSTADVQWVLHSSGEPSELEVRIHRGDEEQTLFLEIPEGWRRGADISWRSTTWLLRGQVLGRMRLLDIPDVWRAGLGLQKAQMALRVLKPFRHQFGAAKAGFRLGDIIVGYGAEKGRMTESEILAWAMRNTRPGQEVPITVLRGDRRLALKLPVK